jgi:hypothetical protein
VDVPIGLEILLSPTLLLAAPKELNATVGKATDAPKKEACFKNVLRFTFIIIDF